MINHIECLFKIDIYDINLRVVIENFENIIVKY